MPIPESSTTASASIVAQVEEAIGRVCRNLRIPQAADLRRRFVREDFRGSAKRNAKRREGAFGQNDKTGQACQNPCQEECGCPEPQRFQIGARGKYLGRRRTSQGNCCSKAIASGQRRGYRACRRGAMQRIHFETSEDSIFHDRVQVRYQRTRRNGPYLLQLPNLAERPAFERPPAREHLIEHDSKRIQVGSDRSTGSGQLLRRHVRRRAALGAFVKLTRYAGEPEICDPDLPLRINHDVRWLQIAMQNAFVVRSLQPLTDGARDFDGPVWGNATDPAQQTAQIFAIDEFH